MFVLEYPGTVREAESDLNEIRCLFHDLDELLERAAKVELNHGDLDDFIGMTRDAASDTLGSLQVAAEAKVDDHEARADARHEDQERWAGAL